MRNTIDIKTKSDIINLILFKRRLKQKIKVLRRVFVSVCVFATLAMCVYHGSKFVNAFNFVNNAIESAVNRIFSIKINKVNVKLAQNSILEDDEVKDIADMVLKNSSSRKNMRAVIDDIMRNNPLIKDMYIHRVIATGELNIFIIEKGILALLIENKGDNSSEYVKKMITIDNKIIPYHKVKTANIMKIVGYYNETIDLAKIIKFLQKYKLTEKIAYIKFSTSGRFDIMLKNNLLLKLPRKNWTNAIMRFIKVDGEYLLSTRTSSINYIDLRTDETRIIAG